jgi:hypothetical protein
MAQRENDFRVGKKSANDRNAVYASGFLSTNVFLDSTASSRCRFETRIRALDCSPVHRSLNAQRFCCASGPAFSRTSVRGGSSKRVEESRARAREADKKCWRLPLVDFDGSP